MGKPQRIKAFATEKFAQLESLLTKVALGRRIADETLTQLEDLAGKIARERGAETHHGSGMVSDYVESSKEALRTRAHKLVTGFSRVHGKPQNVKSDAIEKLAHLQLLVTKASVDHQAATYHENDIAAECIRKAKKDLKMGMDRLLDNELEEALHLADIATLRINFAQQLLEADAVEHLLGESNFLELSDTPATPERMVNYYFFELEHELLNVYARLKD